MNSPHLRPVELRCESLTAPTAIDRTNPELSWKVKATSPKLRNLAQSAYRIRVASDPGLLPDHADLWDSGRVESNATTGIEYAGKAPRSRQECWWTVQTWDEQGVASETSAPSSFAIGLLTPEDWQAKWIAIDAPDSDAHAAKRFTEASWIWSAAHEKGKVPAEKRTFIRSFDLANVGDLEGATISVTADDQFELKVNGEHAVSSDGGTDAWRRPKSVDILRHLRAGNNELRIDASNDGPGAAGVLAKLILTYRSGKEEAIVTDESWTEPDGKAARAVGAYGTAPWAEFGWKVFRGATYYRKDFRADRVPKRAIAYVTALGLVDLHLNGKRVSEDLFTPGWTDYDKRVYYKAYDVTKMIQNGGNAVGAVLGDGWYSGFLGYSGKRGNYGDRPRVRVQLELEYSDGTVDKIATDRSWKASTGPIVEQDFLMGETYDARLKQDGWDRAGFSDSHWLQPYEASNINTLVQAFPSEPVRPYAKVHPESIKQIHAGTYVVDFGQNLAGFAQLRISGKSGQKITLRFAEMLNPDGTLYTANLRGAKATDVYICSGKGSEEWAPRFTFHGFRYAEISGISSAPTKDTITAVAISTATPEVGKIETSDPMLNRLAKNAWWTQKMNFIDIPTDCPQRDERLGWTGDAQAYIFTANMFSDNQAFFHKWLVALDDGQRHDGQYPMVAPLKVAEGDGGPAWADAGTICPWTVYSMYGGKRQLAEHYPQMKKFVEFTRKRGTPDLLPPPVFHCFGDWLNINADTPNEVIYEAYFAGSARIVANSAKVLGYVEDAAQYSQLADQVAAAFRKAYVDNDGVVKGDTQCGYVLALAFDLLTPEQEKIAARRLVDDIEKRGWHLSTGFVGTRDLMHVLSKIGRDDVAFRLLHQTTFPSWKFEIVNGATSIWERWDGWTPEKGMQDPGMNSFAHYAYGAVMGWVFAHIGGIDHTAPGYKEILIAPAIDPHLIWAKTSYDSVQGPIKTSWRVKGGKLTLDVDVPPNTTAEIRVPVAENGQVSSSVPGNRLNTNCESFEVGSGSYRFVADWGAKG